MNGRQTYRRAAVSRRRAFTLIELLLVLVILATLAALVVPRFTKRSEQAKITAAATQIDYMKLALGQFEIDCGRFPTSEETLEALMTAPGSADGWHGPYLDKGVPEDPWGRPYVYRYPAQHPGVDYDLYSAGPDGQENTADDIFNWKASK
jgi:general secretion pathway protein G